MIHIIMGLQKIANVLGNADNESLTFATRKWYVINDQNKTDYGDGDENGTTIKFETEVIKSNLCDYSDAYILVTGDITATGGEANTKIEFKNCATFTKWVTHTNDEHVDNTDNLNIVILMYNLIVTTIQIPQEVYGSSGETNKIWTMVIFQLVLIKLIQHLLNKNQVSLKQ